MLFGEPMLFGDTEKPVSVGWLGSMDVACEEGESSPSGGLPMLMKWNCWSWRLAGFHFHLVRFLL